MNIRKFISKEKITLLILIIMLINPFYYGYRIASLFLVIIFFQLKRYVHLIDYNVLLLLLFGGIYELLKANNIDPIDKSIFSFLPNIFIPSLLYLVGKRISFKYSSSYIRIFFLYLIAFSFSVIPILSILYQIIQNGFTVGERNMHLLWERDSIISATGLASYFTINMGAISLVNIRNSCPFHKRISMGILLLFILSLFCVIRLGSRTQLAVALLSFLLSFLFNFSSLTFLRKIFIVSSIGVILFYSYHLLNNHSELIFYFENRIGSKSAGVDTFGGRSIRWVESLKAIFKFPWGWKLSLYGYAHNLWLDVARTSGILALIPLVIFTISSVKILFKLIRSLKSDLYLRTYILSVFLSIILVFNVEPVMDGMYLVFLLFCLLTGFISGIFKNRVNRKPSVRKTGNIFLIESNKFKATRTQTRTQ